MILQLLLNIAIFFLIFNLPWLAQWFRNKSLNEVKELPRVTLPLILAVSITLIDYLRMYFLYLLLLIGILYYLFRNNRKK